MVYEFYLSDVVRIFNLRKYYFQRLLLIFNFLRQSIHIYIYEYSYQYFNTRIDIEILLYSSYLYVNYNHFGVSPPGGSVVQFSLEGIM